MRRRRGLIGRQRAEIKFCRRKCPLGVNPDGFQEISGLNGGKQTAQTPQLDSISGSHTFTNDKHRPKPVTGLGR